MSTCFKKLFSPVFIDNYEQHKAKRFLHSFVDIAKETACEKNQRKEARLPLELLEVFASLNKRLYLKLYAQFFTAEPVQSHNKICAYIKNLFQGLQIP